MSERPILFSGPMVRAVLDGRKTQSRRILNPQPVQARDGRWDCTRRGKWIGAIGRDGATHNLTCPYGEPGDRLWIRECFALSQADPDNFVTDMRTPDDWDPPVYRADGEEQGGGWTDHEGKPLPPPWRPSIHMPRWASRITLELTAVRIERLQDVTEEDARAEGVNPCGDERCDCAAWSDWSARDQFAKLWDELNGKRHGCGWAESPWVWVLSFRRIAP